MSVARECISCGKRHGERVLVAAMEPLQFGRPIWGQWAWLDENPPERFLRYGAKPPIWRNAVHGWEVKLEPQGPRRSVVVDLWEYVPPPEEFDFGDPYCCCEQCRVYFEDADLRAEGFTITILPRPRVAVSEQLRLLEVA